ncbi:MAG: Endoglucanase [Candidatus Celerinatantimonas neptuna]|nr:MAG: Endoglucanase [Candidatus Celerinatantimonas neptuna]
MAQQILSQIKISTDTPVGRNGHLSINSNGQIIGEGTTSPLTLKGISFHGLNFGPLNPEVNPVGPMDFANRKAVLNLVEKFKPDIIRAPVYLDEWGGFFNRGNAKGENEMYTNPSVNQDNLYGRVAGIISGAVEAGVYVVIDWHLLRPSMSEEEEKDPEYHQTKFWQSDHPDSSVPANHDDVIYSGTIEFFKNMSKMYGDLPNVIFELANEPSKATLVTNDDDWHMYVEPWAKEMIDVIRENDPDPDHPNLISIGTPQWSQLVGVATSSTINEPNIMYNAHIYAASHLYPGTTSKDEEAGTLIYNEIIEAREAGKAVFISEWGATPDNGDGDPDEVQAHQWDDFFTREQLSTCYWNFSNKDETSSILVSTVTDITGPWDNSELTQSGTIIQELLAAHAKS